MSKCGGCELDVPLLPTRSNVAAQLAACNACSLAVLGPRDTVEACREIFGDCTEPGGVARPGCKRKWREALISSAGVCPRGKW